MKIKNIADLNYALGQTGIFDDLQIGIRESFILSGKEFQILPLIEAGNLKINVEMFLPNFNIFELMFSMKFGNPQETVLFYTEIYHIYSDAFEFLNSRISVYKSADIEIKTFLFKEIKKESRFFWTLFLSLYFFSVFPYKIIFKILKKKRKLFIY